MIAKATNLLKFLRQPSQFVIPIYQRPYSWEHRHCNQLWNDLLRVGQDGNSPAHFLGSIVYVESGVYSVSTVPELLVIDGQQRLTTLSLLLLALGKAIGTSTGQIGITRKKLQNYYLFNADEDDELRYKLLLTRRDKETLIRLLDDKEISADVSPRLVENYRFFEARLEREDVNVIYEGLRKLHLVDIALDRDHDDPQLIFESLNSTGLDLSQADLIRNYVLMKQDSTLQKQLYEDYWFPMEESFGKAYTKRFDLFIRDYLTLKTRHIPKIDRVYESFKGELYTKVTFSLTFALNYGTIVTSIKRKESSEKRQRKHRANTIEMVSHWLSYFNSSPITTRLKSGLLKTGGLMVFTVRTARVTTLRTTQSTQQCRFVATLVRNSSRQKPTP